MEQAAAQSAEVVWQGQDKKHKGWMVHLQVGSDVIKYAPPAPGPDQTAADPELVSLALKAAQDEGYELSPTAIKITR
jgi:hypothetical protein